MNRIVFTLLAFFSLNAQEQGSRVDYRVNDGFQKTPPLSTIINVNRTEADLIDPDRQVPKPQRRQFDLVEGYEPLKEDGAIQTEPSFRQGKAPILNFDGLNGAFPPDPSGAPGKNHYVQCVNTACRIYNKADGSGVGAPFSLSNFWPGSVNEGDPIVMYDEFAERWFISQFQSAQSTGQNSILIAISETDDPTGSYYTYQFNFTNFPDYPKYSIWSDGYYMTANMWTDNAVVFERDKMLAGDPTAGIIRMTFPSMPLGGFFSVLPSDADGALPPAGTPNYMSIIADNAWSGASFDHIRIYEMAIDWTTPNNSTLTLSKQIPTSSFDANFTNSWDDIQQKGTSQRLDAIAGVLNYRVQYRNWIGYASMVMCHVVDINGLNRGSVRWYELRDNAMDGNWVLYQESTLNFDDQNRWLGSIAMNGDGDIGIAYSYSGSAHFPGIRFTGRLMEDALNVMSFNEQVAVEGVAAQTLANRYGDYAQLTVDPIDDKTFWYTGEYIGAGGARKTRIFSFQIEDLHTSIEAKQKSWDFKTYKSGDELKVELNDFPGVETLHFQLYSADGKLIEEQTLNQYDTNQSTSFDVSQLATGVYVVRVGTEQFQKTVKVSLD